MALMFLLRLLASLQSLPRPVSPSGLLPAPTLTPVREYTVYAPGEKVELTCQAPAGRDAKEYRFFSQRGQGSPIRVPEDETVPQMLELLAEKGTVGSYTCAYWESNGQTFSENSSSVSVALAAPQLTVSPERLLYTTGESMNLTCSDAGFSDMSGVQFFRNGQSLPTQEFRLSPHSYTASIQLSNTEHPAEYSCEYRRSVNGKEFTSERSQKVLIALKDPLSCPQLTTSPEQPVSITAETITLTCSAAGSPNISVMQFFLDGQKMPSKELPSPLDCYTRSLKLCIPQVLKYTCESWKTECGQDTSSNRTEGEGPAHPDSAYRFVLPAFGGGLLLGGVLATLIFYFRKNKRDPKPDQSTEGSEPRKRTRKQTPDPNKKGTDPTGAGGQRLEKGSAVTYATINMSVLDGHRTASKEKAKPAAQDHVLYSEVARKQN
ncbi:Fc receptor-like protein 5 [Carettochelys insculpta]|uniref:Fc receptor-like protein 5 n=1 Tax=Carettochelys insculpta TaxID=44489 RepID=UPI003EBDC79A